MRLTYTSRNTRCTNMSTHTHTRHTITYTSQTQTMPKPIYTHTSHIYACRTHTMMHKQSIDSIHTHKSRIYHFGVSLGTRTSCFCRRRRRAAAGSPPDFDHLLKLYLYDLAQNRPRGGRKIPHLSTVRHPAGQILHFELLLKLYLYDLGQNRPFWAPKVLILVAVASIWTNSSPMALRRQESALQARTEVSQMRFTYTSRNTRCTNMSTHTRHTITYTSLTQTMHKHVYTHTSYIYTFHTHTHTMMHQQSIDSIHTHKSRIYHFGVSLGTRTSCLCVCVAAAHPLLLITS